MRTHNHAMQGAMANMFYHPGKHYGMHVCVIPDVLLYTVAVILYYITISLYITGSMASILVAIVKTLVVVVW